MNTQQQDRRQHPRTRVSWTIVVHAGASRYLTSSLDISPFGAKVRTNTQLKTGTSVQLEIVPPEGPPLRVGAMVWRVDRDGLAFLFSSGIQHRLLRTTHLPAARYQEVAGRESSRRRGSLHDRLDERRPALLVRAGQGKVAAASPVNSGVELGGHTSAGACRVHDCQVDAPDQRQACQQPN